MTPSLDDLVYILETLKSQIKDELSSHPQGSLGILLKEITDIKTPDLSVREQEDIIYKPMTLGAKVDIDEMNDSKFSF